MKRTTIIALSSLLIFSNANAQNMKFETDQQKISYLIGQQLGRSFKTQGMDLNLDILSASIKDAIAGKSQMSDQDLQDASNKLRAKMTELQAKMREQQAKLGEENKKKGDEFLTQNKAKPGIQTTASGLQYKVIKEGNGAKPTADDTVKVNYRGTLIDGTEFDSSYKRNQPAQFPLKGVIKGWTEGIPLMTIGSKYEFYIPSELAYGANPPTPQIPPNSVLIFEVELLEKIAK